MASSTQITESTMLSRLRVGEVLLAPLVIKSSVILIKDDADARLEVGMPDRDEVFRFVVEAKTRSTPQNIKIAIFEAEQATEPGEWPMIQVPYLSPESILELEKAKVSGVDLCGNGVVMVPGMLWVVRVGQPNQFRDSRPLSNPYKGRSALVARMLLKRPHWQTLSELADLIEHSGGVLSFPQVSKAVQALAEDLMVAKEAGTVRLKDPLRLLDRLGDEWKRGMQFMTETTTGRNIRTQVAPYYGRQSLRLPKGADWIHALSSVPGLEWAVSGESSVDRYAMFAQGGPRQIVVSNVELAAQALAMCGGTRAPVPSLADIELMMTKDAGVFFDRETDEKGMHWAGRLQTWLELQAGDGRQKDAAKEIRAQILKGVQP